jgi:ribosomal protein S18 acetylase RimI-like enzyme/ADP-ribose pyrophosphatase YjhB (NUDIX family)
MSQIQLRRLKPTDSDLTEIAAGLNEADSEVSVKSFTAESLRTFLSDPGRFYLIATIGSRIAGAVHGYLLVHPTGIKYLYIDEVDTVAEFRRQGVATTLLKDAFNHARILGASEVWVGTEADNEPAKKLYLSLNPSEVVDGPIYTYKVAEPSAVLKKYVPYAVPISCKGIVFENDKVWLRHNERDEWELPGGKLDPGEQPEDTVAREMLEGLGVKVRVGRVVSNYLDTIQASLDETRGVLVASYPCKFVERIGDVERNGEAGRAKFQQFAFSEIDGLKMPEFYKQAIKAASYEYTE